MMPPLGRWMAVVGCVAIGATADGELVLHRLRNGKYNLTGHRPALLEAKKRFAVIKDGRPAFTDQFLGQMILALAVPSQ